MSDSDSQSWRTYEEVATYLLGSIGADFGLARVESKQRIDGVATTWEIDAKGVRVGDEGGIIIIECRRLTTSKLKQEDLAAVAYRIRDTGSIGGIVVSPLGFQEGALKIAQAENIVEVKLSPDSTKTDLLAGFLGRLLMVKTEGVDISESVVFVLKAPSHS